MELEDSILRTLVYP